MSIENDLLQRSGSKCELCGCEKDLKVYEVAPSDGSAEQSALLCEKCKEQFEDSDKIDVNHWHCLNDTMWSEIPVIKVLSYRMLKKINNHELLDMMYLEDSELEWANALEDENQVITKDSNGAVLNSGDTVTLIKDLEVKGAGFTAKRGTSVRNIYLTDNSEQIEGRVNGVKIVLLTKFLKKA